MVIQGSRDDLISVGSTDSKRISTLTEKDHGEFPSAHAAHERKNKTKKKKKIVIGVLVSSRF